MFCLLKTNVAILHTSVQQNILNILSIYLTQNYIVQVASSYLAHVVTWSMIYIRYHQNRFYYVHTD
jgi:hypothetical protein